MEIPTKKIKMPICGAEVEIKDWITGEEAEYIDDALLEAVKVTPSLVNKSVNISNFEVGKIKEETHRSFEKFILAVNGIKTDVLKTVMTFPEEDYKLLISEIKDRRGGKKKEAAGASEP